MFLYNHNFEQQIQYHIKEMQRNAEQGRIVIQVVDSSRKNSQGTKNLRRRVGFLLVRFGLHLAGSPKATLNEVMSAR
jgi:hypothetical protein